jgi:hypothetical protein
MGVFDRGCEDGLAPKPGRFACGWLHCRNNCIGVRYMGGGLLGRFAASAGSLLTEDLQLGAAVVTGGTSPSTWSGHQRSDLRESNPLGRRLGADSTVASVSCEQLCSSALGGHATEDFGVETPSAIWEFFHGNNK